jgi:hypothetical protein
VAARVQETVHLTPQVEPSVDKANWTVRVGDLQQRAEAQALAARLSHAGLPGAFVVEEQTAAGRGRLRLLETGEELAGAAIVPAVAGDTLWADSSPYRGYFEVAGRRPDRDRAQRDQPRGLPAGGGSPARARPAAFPETALKAQGATRGPTRSATRALSLGLRPTAACRLPGALHRHPLTDQAVAETRGLVANYRGPSSTRSIPRPAATTGGWRGVFEATRPSLPAGVVCAPELGVGRDQDQLGAPIVRRRGRAEPRAALLVALGADRSTPLRPSAGRPPTPGSPPGPNAS